VTSLTDDSPMIKLLHKQTDIRVGISFKVIKTDALTL
jgi:hypothetical protein